MRRVTWPNRKQVESTNDGRYPQRLSLRGIFQDCGFSDQRYRDPRYDALVK